MALNLVNHLSGLPVARILHGKVSQVQFKVFALLVRRNPFRRRKLEPVTIFKVAIKYNALLIAWRNVVLALNFLEGAKQQLVCVDLIIAQQLQDLFKQHLLLQ